VVLIRLIALLTTRHVYRASKAFFILDYQPTTERMRKGPVTPPGHDKRRQHHPKVYTRFFLSSPSANNF